MNNLERIGYNEWFQQHADAGMLLDHQIARVVTVHRDRIIVSQGGEDIVAELIGKLAYSANSSTDLPTTGDWVYIDIYDENTRATIYDVVPRKTLIKRKKSGKTTDFQLIAANVDTAFIVQALDDDFNISRLERYLVMINESNITPIILLSKSDISAQSEIKIIIDNINSIAPDLTVLSFSNKRGDNLDGIKALLLPGHTYCLLGSSGVGKTTLLNNLIGSGQFETKPVREKDGKGQHTTTRRELIQLKNGAMIIDTPGMRELGNIAIEIGMRETFNDIQDLALGCKFNDCAHSKEKGCAVLAAIDAGTLPEQRYQNYIKMKRESSFNEMSYIDKRKKDKNFGKLIKTAIGNKTKDKL